MTRCLLIPAGRATSFDSSDETKRIDRLGQTTSVMVDLRAMWGAEASRAASARLPHKAVSSRHAAASRENAGEEERMPDCLHYANRRLPQKWRDLHQEWEEIA